MKLAVIGLGVAGLSICARLAQAGHEVSGFEKSPKGPAKGSSRGDTRIFRLIPGEGSIYVDLAEIALQGWQALAEYVGQPLINWTSGYMAGPPMSHFVRSCVRLASEHRREYTVVEAAEVLRVTSGWVTFPPGWEICHLKDCGVIRANEAIIALIQFALDQGAQLYWNVQAEAPVEGGRLDINGSWKKFDRIIVSSGPWMPSLLPEFAHYVQVTRKVVAWFAPKESSALPPDLPLVCLDDSYGTYGMPTPSGFYKIGLDAADQIHVQPDAVPPPHTKDIAVIAETVQRYLPRLNPAPVQADACMYTTTPDWNFLIGQTPNTHALCVSCCSGHGFKHAPGVAQIVLDWVENRDNPFLKAFGTGLGRTAPVVKVGDQA